MPRNSSGTYTLPSGNPVSSGTLIEASWANSTLSDLASAMTGSLSRAGEGGMTAALRLFDGTVSLPGLAFTSETSTGLYRAGSGDMRLAVTGSQVMQFLSTGVAVTGTLSASGTLSVTGASTFSGQTNTFENATAYYPQLISRNKTSDANGSYISLQKIRSSSIVQSGDVLGNVIFSGYDGAAYLQGAYINAVISATPGTNDMPTDLVFGTTPDGSAGPTERFRITQAGDAYIRGGKGLAWYDSGNSGYWAQYNSSGAFVFSNGTERMRLDASGNLGLGITPSAWGASFKAIEIANGASLFSYSTNAYLVANAYFDGSNYKYKTTQVAALYAQASGAHQWYTAPSGTAGATATFAQTMTLDASGNLLVNTTALQIAGYAKLSVKGTTENIGTSGQTSSFISSAGTGSQTYVHFSVGSGATATGTITTNGSTTAYNTTSDYRLKENISPMMGALNKVAELKPVTYTWKSTGEASQGFIAHELQAVVPDAVHGEKDAVDADGNPVYQGIDTSFLVATLTAAIQEQQAIIAQMQADIAALKATP